MRTLTIQHRAIGTALALIVGILLLSPTATRALAQDAPDDPDADLKSERKFWTGLAEREVSGLSDATDKWPISTVFLGQVESHYTTYLELEGRILKDLETEDGLVPKKPEFISMMLKSDDFTLWSKEKKLTAEDWIRRLCRLRGMIGAKSYRDKYNKDELQKRFDALTNGPVPDGISPQLLKDLARGVEISLLIAPDIIKILDKHEPKWGDDELVIREAYFAELKSYLFNPKANPFNKEAIDKRRAEEAKKKEGEQPNNKPEGKDSSDESDDTK